jgi:hypothetical protein
MPVGTGYIPGYVYREPVPRPMPAHVPRPTASHQSQVRQFPEPGYASSLGHYPPQPYPSPPPRQTYASGPPRPSQETYPQEPAYDHDPDGYQDYPEEEYQPAPPPRPFPPSAGLEWRPEPRHRIAPKPRHLGLKRLAALGTAVVLGFPIVVEIGHNGLNTSGYTNDASHPIVRAEKVGGDMMFTAKHMVQIITFGVKAVSG